MFDSRAAFQANALDSTRMTIGSFKIAGLLLAMLAAARFWWTRHLGRAWYDPRTIAWGRLALGFVTFGLVPFLPELAKAQIGEQAVQWVSLALSIILLPMLFLMLAGLFGDRKTPVSSMWRSAWPWLVLTLVLVVAGFAPSAWLHQKNHAWALGTDQAVVWALMIFDSLLVGLMAGLTGTALYLGYAAFARPELE
jgi:uncharacterized membrane protein YidH (DUF202 family)